MSYYIKFTSQEEVNAFCSLLGKEAVIYAGSDIQTHFYLVNSNLFFVLPIEAVADFCKENILLPMGDLLALRRGYPDGFRVRIKNKKEEVLLRNIIEACNPFAIIVAEAPAKKQKDMVLSIVFGCSLEAWMNDSGMKTKRIYAYHEFKNNAGSLILPYRLLKLGRHQYDSADSIFAKIMEEIGVWGSEQGLRINVNTPEDFDSNKYYGIYLFLTPGKINVILEEKIETLFNPYSERIDVNEFLKNSSKYFVLYRRL